MANISGGGLYHHATTGLTTMLTENFTASKDTLPLSSEAFSGRRSVDGKTGQTSFYQPKGKGILANTLKESILQPAYKQNSEAYEFAKKSQTTKDIAGQLNLLPNNSAVHK